MNALTFDRLIQATKGRLGIHDIACPLCGPDRRSPANRVRKVLRVWYVSPDFISYACAAAARQDMCLSAAGERSMRGISPCPR